MIYLTGCTHFDHANIIKMADRPFADVDEMNAALVDRWNDVVSYGDTVYHLGDFSWGDPAPWLRRLHFKTMILIRGNHDSESKVRIMKRDTRVVVAPYAEIPCPGGSEHRKMALFHYPIQEWNGWFRGNLHAHCHTHSPIRETARGRVNVTVEARDYRPVELCDLARQADAVFPEHLTGDPK